MHTPDGEILWDATVGEMAIARARLAAAMPDVHPFTAGHLGADDAQITAAAARLGHPLDAHHEALLRRVDGWPWMILDADLLPVQDLGASPLFDRGQHLLDLDFSEAGPHDAPPRENLLPFAVSNDQIDVMAIATTGPLTNGGHQVFWFAPFIIQAWDNLYDWWASWVQMHLEDAEEEITGPPGPA